ncbi:MAG: hypothetical protein ABI663_20145 [Chryseolinea sp.]
MKKIAKYFGCFVLVALVANVTFAQTSGSQKDQPYPRILENKVVSERLQKDWKKRNSAIQAQPVQWFELGDGFYGSYENSDHKFMTLYDHDGNYIQTYKKSDWNNATASAKAAYDISIYKTQPVLSYWEVYDADKRGYYLELDNQGKNSHVWLNDAGEFSTTVPRIKPKS